MCFHKKSSPCLKCDHSKNSMVAVALTHIHLWHQSMWKLSFWAKSSNPFTRYSVLAFLNYSIFFMKSEKLPRKIPETLTWEYHQQKHCICWLVFSKKRLLFMHSTNITIINICDKQDSWRSASRFLSKIVDKWENRKRCWNHSGRFQDLLNFFALFQTALKRYEKQHNHLQVVVESISFTDFIDFNSKDLKVLYFSTKM